MIKKIFLTMILLVSTLILTSCKTDFSKYSGKFEISSYESEDTEVIYDFELIIQYDIELLDNGFALHKLHLGVMDEPAEFNNNYDISEKNNQIHFYIKNGLAVLYKETWEYTSNQIIMELLVPIVKEPDQTNITHYIKTTVYLDRVV